MRETSFPSNDGRGSQRGGSTLLSHRLKPPSPWYHVSDCFQALQPHIRHCHCIQINDNHKCIWLHHERLSDCFWLLLVSCFPFVWCQVRKQKGCPQAFSSEKGTPADYCPDHVSVFQFTAKSCLFKKSRRYNAYPSVTSLPSLPKLHCFIILQISQTAAPPFITRITEN